MSKALVLGAAALVFSAVGASAAGLVAPAYNTYAALAYLAPAPTYTAPPVYVAPAPVYPAPVVSQPIHDYAPGYGYDYTAPGYWNRGYWGRDYGFEWR
jgi:hypothetical protein